MQNADMISNSLILLSALRREKWKKRQEEKRILEIFMEHQKMIEEKEEVDEKKFSYGACVAEVCIIGN